MVYLDNWLNPAGFPKMTGPDAPINPLKPKRNAWDQQVLGGEVPAEVQGAYAGAYNPARTYQRLAQAYSRGAPASTYNAVTAARLVDPSSTLEADAAMRPADNMGPAFVADNAPGLAATVAQADQAALSGRMEAARQGVNYATVGSGFSLRDAMQNGGRSTPSMTFNSDYGYGDKVTARAGPDGRINQFSGVGGGGSGVPNQADYNAAVARAAADRARLAPEPVAQAPALPTLDTSHPFDAEINRLSSSDGIVDQWKARRMAHTRNLDMAERTAALNAQSGQTSAQATAMRAGNEVPLAQMLDLTARQNAGLVYGAHLQSDATMRRGQDMTAAERKAANEVAIRGQDAIFAPHAGIADMQAQAAKYSRLGTPEGDARAREIMDNTIQRWQPQERAAKTVMGVDGSLHTYAPDGTEISAQSPAEQQAAAKKRLQDAAAKRVAEGLPTLTGP
jgi:hypothetical protein